MLTIYDDYPVHQYQRPFSEIPSTDLAWDDGYYMSVWSAEHRIYLNMIMRINPNVDVVGGSVNLVVEGTQYTVRLSRVWRPDCDTHIGPYRYRFVEPFKDIHLTLGPNESPVTFDIHWFGVGPAFLEAHHAMRSRGRFTINQTRYVQTGEPEGWIEVAGTRYDVDRRLWAGSRDHSWGQYVPRGPLGAPLKYLPPETPKPELPNMRFWTMFKLPDYSGFYNLLEDEGGVCRDFNHHLGTSFEGAIDRGWDERIELVSARHELTFKPGTRMLAGGKVYLTDVRGDQWIQEFEVATLPFLLRPIGYWAGAWRDGGTFQTYHGDGPVIEWETIDVSGQPMDYRLPDGTLQTNAHGVIYGARLRMTAPDGTVSEGLQHITFWAERAYKPYGFSEDFPPSNPWRSTVAEDHLP